MQHTILYLQQTVLNRIILPCLLVTVWFWLILGGMSSCLAQELPTNNNGEVGLEQPALDRPTLDPNILPSEKISQFVHAYLQVLDLIERREGELQAAETESESVHLKAEIEAEALVIIEKAGLTRPEYLQILGLANIDPEFGERIAAQLQEATN